MKFEKQWLIMVLSGASFSFMSFLYYFTVKKFFRFYNNIHQIIQVPLFLLSLDFVSNIIVGLAICISALFYLLRSENLEELVLNSFALWFILEIDDMANIYESDEEHLVSNDWSNLEIKGGDYNNDTKKRKIKLIKGSCWNQIGYSFLALGFVIF